MIKRRDVLKLPATADPAASAAALRGHLFIRSTVDGHGRYWRGALCIAPDAHGTPILTLAHGDDPNVTAPLAELRLGRSDGATLHGVLNVYGVPEALPVDPSAPLVLCPSCHGIESDERCSLCDGSGQVPERKACGHLSMMEMCRDIVAEQDRRDALR
jgi:hypothetical protein